MVLHMPQGMDEIMSYSSTREDEPFRQGAEARLFRCEFLGRKAVYKQRFVKKYRHAQLDAMLTRARVKAELKAIAKCRKSGIDVPAVYFADTEDTHCLILEHIDGELTVREWIERVAHLPDSQEMLERVGRHLGEMIARLHLADLVHGDLTTSNFLCRGGDPQRVVMIDFGLSQSNVTVEDKAVDLYVLERAIASTHPKAESLFQRVMDGYGSCNHKQCHVVEKKLDEIRLRGRKRDMLG